MIKKFAKATALGLSAVMVLGLTACGGNGDKKTTYERHYGYDRYRKIKYG